MTTNTIVIGLQYGDEGKARFVDQLAADHDIVVRFNGGANAGHTVVANGKKLALRQVPAGIFYPETQLYIGSGCMVNLAKIVQEINELSDAEIEVSSRLKIAARAGVIQPHHILLDKWLGKDIGTTGNGIGPAYADRCYRMWEGRQTSISFGDLVCEPERMFMIMKAQLESVCKNYSLEIETGLTELSDMKAALEICKEFIEKDPLFLSKEMEKGKSTLAEGAQSVMLDVTNGTTPYVTSSSTVAAAAHVGGDIPLNFTPTVLGVAKAIMSRVGHGPFVSETGSPNAEAYCMSRNEDDTPKYSRLVEDEYDHATMLRSEDSFDQSKALRHYSGEYGVGTKRPRRIGALDLIQLNYAIKSNAVTELILTKCDLLNLYSKTAKGQIPLVTGYTLNGVEIDYYPATTSILAEIEPVFTFLPSFTEDISKCTKSSELPQALLDYLKFISEFIDCKIRGIGVGPERDEYIPLT